MQRAAIYGAVLLPMVLVAGCDNITGLDNREPPNAVLTGRVVYQGEPVGVRNNEVQLELWEPAYFDRFGQLEKIPVHVAQDGTFAATVFDGTYKLNQLANNGPWINSSDTLLINVSGSANVDVEVVPYYTIANPSFSRGDPTQDIPGGTITATFKVGQIETSRDLEYVGLYIGVTQWVDRINSVPIPNSMRERTLAQIEPQLMSNGDITITVDLPADIYESNSPWIRDFVFARVGVKTVGVNQMLFSPVFEVGI